MNGLQLFLADIFISTQKGAKTHMRNNISRRDLLRGLGLGAAAGVAGVRTGFNTVQAQVSPSDAPATAFYRRMLGDMTITVIKDGSSPLNVEILGNEDQQQEVQDLLAAAGAPTDQLINTFNIVMIQTGDDTYLIDTGLGAMTSGLLPTMDLLGVMPADVTGVIGTHWHPDHTNGLSNEGEIVFPNAMYYLSQTEFDFVQANADAFTGTAAAKIAPYADNDQLSLYNAEDEIVPGVQAVAAFGHTLGHHAMLVSSNGNSLLHTVDSLFVPPLQMANPNIGIQFDADPTMAAESRRALLERAADEGIPIMSYHMPFPGMGLVARDGDAFSFYAYN